MFHIHTIFFWYIDKSSVYRGGFKLSNHNKYLYFGFFTFTVIIVLVVSLFFDHQRKEDSTLKTSHSNHLDDSHVIVNTDYQYYDSFEALFESSSTVITGKVLSYQDKILNIAITEDEIHQLEGITRAEKENLINDSKTPEYFPYRIFDIEVTETYKGEHETGDIIQVKQLYGKLDNSFYDNEFLLNTGYEYLLFLEDYPNSPSSLLNQEQSSYFVDKNIKDDETLKPVNKENKNIKISKKTIKNMKMKKL